MTKEELQAILAEAVKPFNDRFSKIEADLATVLSSAQAAAKIRNDVEPHAVALDNQATALEAAGIDATALRKMASDMRAEALAGRMPTKLAAAAVAPAATTVAPVASDAAVAELIAAALRPIQNQLEEANTKLKDVETAGRLQAAAPGRKTIAPSVTNVLAKSGLDLPADNEKLKIADVDKALASSNIPLQQRIMLKNELGRIGAL